VPRPRRLGLLAAAIALFALLATAPGASVGAAATSNDCQAAVPKKSASALRSDGTEASAASNDNQGRVYRFGSQQDDIRQVVAPPNFKPLEASDQELKTYGFEPRPADPAMLAHWKSLYANYHTSTDVPSMCTTSQRAAWYHTTSPIWSGASAMAPRLTKSRLGLAKLHSMLFVRRPRICDVVRTWRFLFQQVAPNGYLCEHSSQNVIFDFWEVVNAQHDSRVTQWGHYVNPGELHICGDEL